MSLAALRSPTPVCTVHNLDVYRAADFREAFEDAVNALKPPSAIDYRHVEACVAAHESVVFSDDAAADHEARSEAVQNDLAGDFWRMWGGDPRGPSRWHWTQAAEALRRFKSGDRALKYEDAVSGRRVNFEKSGVFVQRDTSADQVLDSFVLANDAIALDGDHYEMPKDRDAKVEVLVGPGDWACRLQVLAKIDGYASGIQDFVGMHFPLNRVISKHGSGMRGLLPLVVGAHAGDEPLSLRGESETRAFAVRTSELMTTNTTVKLTDFREQVAALNRFLYYEDDGGIVRGVGTLHTHNIFAASRLEPDLKMVLDLIQDKSLRRHLSRGFSKWARTVTRKSQVGAEEWLGYLSPNDFLALYSDDYLGVPGHKTSVLFSAIAEMDELGESVRRVNVVNPVGEEWCDEEEKYRVEIAQEAKRAMTEALQNGCRVSDPEQGTAIVEFYLGMKDITTRDELPEYVWMGG